MIRALAAAVLALTAAPLWAAGVSCAEREHDGALFDICEVDARHADLRLFLDDDGGGILGYFAAVDDILAAEGLRLRFGMNAGMYHSNRQPVGLFVTGGREHTRLVRGAGPGNFGLVPNGVFCIGKNRADVIETERFADRRPDCVYATQSGPMLVIDGALHPRFLIDSRSRHVRNGVGSSADGTRVVFAISRQPVTFHAFARLFRDALALPNALYLDGKVSRLYAPDLGRHDHGFPLGPIVGVVEPRGD